MSNTLDGVTISTCVIISIFFGVVLGCIAYKLLIRNPFPEGDTAESFYKKVAGAELISRSLLNMGITLDQLGICTMFYRFCCSYNSEIDVKNNTMEDTNVEIIEGSTGVKLLAQKNNTSRVAE